MKSKILIAIILLITINSCKDFLEVIPETVVSNNNFYQSESDFDQAVIGAYAPLQPIYEQDWRLTELRSDNTHFFFNVGNRGPKPIEDFATFTIETNNINLQNKWLNNYLIIGRTNEVIERIDDIDIEKSSKDNLKGQAYFLRALAYFDLVKNFGGVPLILQAPTSYAETFQTRSSVNAIYDQIISDASNAINLLPTRSNQDRGRASSGAANTLLADVFLTLGRWPEVQSTLQPVLNMGYNLLPEYADIFKPSNEGNLEIIFEVEYMEGTSQFLHSTFPYNFLPELTDPSVITGVGPAARNGTGSFNTPTPDLLNAYEDKVQDRRYSASIAFYSGDSPLPGITYEDAPYIKKYQHPHSIPNQTGQNWIIYRYAEVLLMFAESLNEQGNPSEALPYLNLVRDRAGLDDINTTDPNELREIILNERRIELAFENKRWHDLVRTGKAVEVMNAHGAKVKANPQDYYYAEGNAPFPNSYSVTENNLIYPIPVSEIVINPDLVQNPGY